MGSRSATRNLHSEDNLVLMKYREGKYRTALYRGEVPTIQWLLDLTATVDRVLTFAGRVLIRSITLPGQAERASTLAGGKTDRAFTMDAEADRVVTIGGGKIDGNQSR